MAAAGKPTLMICYSESDSRQVKKITDSLKHRGYTLFNPMTETGNPLANMAKGVENCIVILLCVSDAFAKDHLCEKAVEYAFNKSKSMLFLKVQENYDPSGFVGILMGMEQALDFSGQQVFATSMEQLCKKIPADTTSKAVEQAIDAFKQLYIKAKEKQAVKK